MCIGYFLLLKLLVYPWTCLSSLLLFRFCILDSCHLDVCQVLLSYFEIIFSIHYFPSDSACGNGSMAQQAAATDWPFCLSHFTTLATTIWTLKVNLSFCVTSSQVSFFSDCQSKSVYENKGTKNSHILSSSDNWAVMNVFLLVSCW